jgi:hypothetical protein
MSPVVSAAQRDFLTEFALRKVHNPATSGIPDCDHPKISTASNPLRISFPTSLDRELSTAVLRLLTNPVASILASLAVARILALPRPEASTVI